MKKFIVLFILLLVIPFSACAVNTNESIKEPSVEVLPIPTPPTDSPTFEEEQEEKKKSYAVSTVNGLRIRSAPNGNSSVLGSLDKDDAVLIIDKIEEYYQTVYKEKTAYIHKDYCKIMEIEPVSEVVERAIDIGSELLGHPYVWGSERYHWGNGVLNKNFVAGEFDCSALVQYAYYKADKILLDVTSRAQSYNGKEVKKSELKRGDLMFFTNASRKNKTGVERIGHVAIYFGNNYILHTASDHAVIEPISNLRWSYYISARRVA